MLNTDPDHVLCCTCMFYADSKCMLSTDAKHAAYLESAKTILRRYIEHM